MCKTVHAPLNHGGTPDTFRIELFETSGPVSPKYQYSTNIILFTSGTSITLDYNDVRKYMDGQPAEPVKLSASIAAKDAAKIVRKLSKLDVVKTNASADLIGSARNRIGISFNRFSIRIDPEIDLKVEYLLSDYDRKEFAGYLKVIELIKGLIKLIPGRQV